jgi:hypothetical protein
VDFVVEKCANARALKSHGFGRQVKTVADGPGLEMSVPVAAVAVQPVRPLQVGDD